MTVGAERLDVSQPAVSKQVQELERVLGVHLFDRIGRRVHLSQAGEILADYAKRLLALAHEAEETLAEVRAVGRGRLVIGASTSQRVPGRTAGWRSAKTCGWESLFYVSDPRQHHAQTFSTSVAICTNSTLGRTP
jgi:hypothetical protein